jgi:hypothetical protein
MNFGFPVEDLRRKFLGNEDGVFLGVGVLRYNQLVRFTSFKQFFLKKY